MALLRVVLDQLGPGGHPDLAEASRALLAGLVEAAPRNCTVEAILPAGVVEPVEGVASVRRLSLPRRELVATWQFGVAPGVGGGMIHSATLLAPLVRHDRLNDHDQTVPTLWDLRAWTAPDRLPRTVVAAQRALLRRAVRHADAVVVPSHAMADRLGEIAGLGDRIRVIAGAAAPEATLPSDAAERRAAVGIPARYLLLTGDGADLAPGFAATAAAELDAVVLDIAEGAEPRIAEIAAEAGLAASRLHVRGALEPADRGAVIGGAAAFLALESAPVWPWRLLEAMALGIPVVAVEGGVHRDVVAEGGLVVTSDEMAAAVEDVVGEGARRQSVLAVDRSRAFSWRGAAEHVWALHAEL